MHEEKTETINQSNEFSMQSDTVHQSPVEQSETTTGVPESLNAVPASPALDNSNKGFYIIVVLVALVLVAVGGTYVYLSNTSTPNKQKQAAATTNPNNQMAVAQTNDTQSGLTDQLNAIDLGNLDTDFQPVDQNLKSL